MNMQQFRSGLVVTVWLGLAGLPLDSPAADVSVWLVKKGLEYTQASSGAPVVNGTNGYAFEADVVMATDGSVTGASLQPPAGLPLQALSLSSSQSKWELKHKYNSQTKLDQHYPDGGYTFSIATKNDGARQLSAQLLGDVYPNGPHLQNFAAVQTVNANGYSQVVWDALTGGTRNDYVQFRLQDLAGNKILETPGLGKLGAWDGTATRILLAPGTLFSRQTNQLTLEFQKSVATDTNSYPGALGRMAYYGRTTVLLVTSAATRPDVQAVEVYKASKWVQTDTNTVVLQAGHEFVFDASVAAYNTGVLSSATLVPPPPNSTPRTLTLQSDGATLDFSETTSTQATLDSAYGSGNYTVSFGTAHDGNKTLTLPLPADALPPAPRFSNFGSLQTIMVGRPCVISWESWAGGTLNDFVQVRVEDAQHNKIFETPDIGKAGALDGRATTITIPANTLPANQSLEIHLTFKRVNAMDTTSYPGVLSLSSFQARTKISVQTIVAPAPLLSLAELAGNQGYQLSFATVAGLTYRIDGSSNLVQWAPLSTNLAGTTLLQWQDSSARAGFFYRAVVLP